MKKITINTIKKWYPCSAYRKNNYALVKKLWAGRKGVTALDVMEMPIPHLHKLWFLFRCGIKESSMPYFAADVARALYETAQFFNKDPKCKIKKALDKLDEYLEGRASEKALLRAYDDLYLEWESVSFGSYGNSCTYAVLCAVLCAKLDGVSRMIRFEEVLNQSLPTCPDLVKGVIYLHLCSEL